MDNLWLKVESIVEKGEIGRFEQFLLLSLFSKSCLLQSRQKASIWGKGLTPHTTNLLMKVLLLIKDKNIVAQGEIAISLAISPFATMISKAVCFVGLKMCRNVGKGEHAMASKLEVSRK